MYVIKKKEGKNMAVVINNKPSMEGHHEHRFYEYYGFIDSEGDFFIITENDSVVLMNDNFTSHSVYTSSIEDFLSEEFNTTLVRAYKKDDFDVVINLK
jgi:hypothetical protein